MATYNMNRDYLVIADVKKGGTSPSSSMSFYNTDKKISNIFVKLQITMSSNNDIKGFVSKEQASNYSIKMTVVKPKTNLIKEINGVIQDISIDGNGAVYLFDLPKEFTDQVGNYICELEVKCLVDGQEEILTCDPFMYTVKPSVLTGLNPEIEANPDLPILKKLIEEVRELQANGGGGSGSGHSHANKSTLDKITDAKYNSWDGKSNANHTHANLQPKTDETLTTVSKEVVGAINENSELIKTLNNSKYDNAILNGGVLELYANGVKKKSITLPTSSGGGGTNGQDGREIELQKSSTHIQWRYVGDTNWTDLVALTELKGRDGLTTSVTVNGTKYNHTNGNITLPDYPSGNGLTSVNLTVVSGNVTMTSDDIQNITLSENVNIILPQSLVNKELILNINCTTKDIIVTFKNNTENIKVKISQNSYNTFTINCNLDDYILERKSTEYPILSVEEINQGILSN